MDNQWKAENEFSWSDITGKTNITALYPVYPDLDYIQENLYKPKIRNYHPIHD